MDCPQCKGYKLEPREIEPNLLAAACVKCEGVFLSLMNYRFWVDRVTLTSSDSAIEEEMVTTDNTKALACPKCARFMTKFNIGKGVKNRIDLCTGCDEAWLDKGEWRLLKKLDLHGKLPKLFTDAWQRNIRLQKQEQRLNSRFQTLLGDEDFRKVDAFKQWLNKHEQASDIHHFLTVKFD